MTVTDHCRYWNFCRIDYQDQASVDTITVCNKKPERVCNLSKVELSRTKASFNEEVPIKTRSGNKAWKIPLNENFESKLNFVVLVKPCLLYNCMFILLWFLILKKLFPFSSNFINNPLLKITTLKYEILYKPDYILTSKMKHLHFYYCISRLLVFLSSKVGWKKQTLFSTYPQ